MPVFPSRSLLARPRRRRAIDRRPAIGLEPLESRLALSALPVVQSVLPPSGGGTAAGGGQVTIMGSSFDGVTEVKFGGTKAENYKTWAKRVKVFCNSQCRSLRQALDDAVAQTAKVQKGNLKLRGDREFVAAIKESLFDFLVISVKGPGRHASGS